MPGMPSTPTAVEIVSVDEEGMRARVCLWERGEPDALLVRDARRSTAGVLETEKRTEPPSISTSDLTPRPGGRVRTRPPVMSLTTAKALLVNGIFGDPLLHVRLRHRRRSLLFDLGDAARLPARIVDSTRPLREVVCDYAGVVGFVSAALRDARGCCDHAFVVGMVAASKAMFPNPKFIFGDSEGIDWIEEDGTYSAGAFQRRPYRAPKRPTLMELLQSLRQRKNADGSAP